MAQRRFAEALSLLAPIEEKVRKAIGGTAGSFRHPSLVGVRGQARAGLAHAPGRVRRGGG